MLKLAIIHEEIGECQAIINARLMLLGLLGEIWGLVLPQEQLHFKIRVYI